VLPAGRCRQLQRCFEVLDLMTGALIAVFMWSRCMHSWMLHNCKHVARALQQMVLSAVLAKLQ
jgi:hypothetical protein